MDIFHLNANQLEHIIFHNAPIPIAYVSTDGKFLKANDAWSDMLGYSEFELIGMNFQDITHPQDIKPDEEMVKKLIANPNEFSKYSMIKRYIDKQGKSHWVELFVTSYIENGKVKHFVAHVIPLPNGGRFKVEKVDEKTLHVRPTVTMWQFIKDNWQWFAGFIIPAFTAFVYFTYKFAIVLNKVLEELDIIW